MNDPKAVTIWAKIEGLDALAGLALNLHWSWNHAADNVWEYLDPELVGGYAKSMGRPTDGVEREDQICVDNAGVSQASRRFTQH